MIFLRPSSIKRRPSFSTEYNTAQPLRTENGGIDAVDSGVLAHVDQGHRANGVPQAHHLEVGRAEGAFAVIGNPIGRLGHGRATPLISTIKPDSAGGAYGHEKTR